MSSCHAYDTTRRLRTYVRTYTHASRTVAGRSCTAALWPCGAAARSRADRCAMHVSYMCACTTRVIVLVADRCWRWAPAGLYFRSHTCMCVSDRADELARLIRSAQSGSSMGRKMPDFCCAENLTGRNLFKGCSTMRILLANVRVLGMCVCTSISQFAFPICDTCVA